MTTGSSHLGCLGFILLVIFVLQHLISVLGLDVFLLYLAIGFFAFVGIFYLFLCVTFGPPFIQALKDKETQ